MSQGLDRYHRQMLLPGFGEDGQARLGHAKALLVGCGALGSIIADSLCRAGVGCLVIADRDVVELTNLQRQVLFDERDAAEATPKAEAARRKLSAINSQVRVDAVVDDVNHTNIERLADGCGVIVDGTDNFETRYLINDVAVKHGVPYVYGGAVGTVGMCYTILPHTPGGDAPWERIGRATPDLRDLFDQPPPPGSTPTCDTAGVLGPAVGVVAHLQAAEAIKVLLGAFEAVNPKMVHVDLWANTIRQFDVAAAYGAGDGVCSKQRRFDYLNGARGSGVTSLCGRNAVQITRPDRPAGPIDFDRIADRLRAHGDVRTSRFMLRANLTDGGEPYELTLFTDGRAIVKGTDEPATARSIYARYVGA